MMKSGRKQWSLFLQTQSSFSLTGSSSSSSRRKGGRKSSSLPQNKSKTNATKEKSFERARDAHFLCCETKKILKEEKSGKRQKKENLGLEHVDRVFLNSKHLSLPWQKVTQKRTKES
tara:strand:+ start:1951 stop:2301 length:351 start_codon:yes stop_codon:yes gene_type:complete